MTIPTTDLLARLDGTVHDVIGGAVRIHDELGGAVARSIKAASFGRIDESIERIYGAEKDVVSNVGEGLKRASTITADTLRRVGDRIRG